MVHIWICRMAIQTVCYSLIQMYFILSHNFLVVILRLFGANSFYVCVIFWEPYLGEIIMYFCLFAKIKMPSWSDFISQGRWRFGFSLQCLNQGCKRNFCSRDFCVHGPHVPQTNIILLFPVCPFRVR